MADEISGLTCPSAIDRSGRDLPRRDQQHQRRQPLQKAGAPAAKPARPSPPESSQPEDSSSVGTRLNVRV